MTIAGNRQLLQQLVAEGKLKPAPSVSPIVPPTAYPIPDLVPTLNPFLRGPMPASTLFDTDIARQFHHQAIPQTRILPLAAAANAQINATAQSIAQQVFTSSVTIGLSTGGITAHAQDLITDSTLSPH